MKPEPRKHYRYAIACPTSMGVRLTPENRMPVHSSTSFVLQATSAESNVLSIASHLGMECLVLTKFIRSSPISAFIKSQLRARNISYVGAEADQGGPWGLRHQFNIADSGFGLRAPRVWNDRAGEVGRTMSIDEFDTEKIFVSDGVGILHISGLIAALSPGTAQLCLELARLARANGSLVSFDLNYRASFWKNQEQLLHPVFNAIASLSDILIGNEEDFQLCLGLKGPDAGGRELSEKLDSFKKMIDLAKARYPQTGIFATTLRQVISANEHLWGCIMLADEKWHIVPPRPISVMDRIGGGDGFTGGLLYALLTGHSAEDCAHFAWASGALAACGMNDFAQPADEKQIWDIYAGNARVQR